MDEDVRKKYELCGYPINNLYRIRALRDFGDVKSGDLGGWISGEHNLSHCFDCWVYDESMVFGNAMVIDNAKVYHCAQVFGDVLVYDNAKIHCGAVVSGNIAIGTNIDWLHNFVKTQ